MNICCNSSKLQLSSTALISVRGTMQSRTFVSWKSKAFWNIFTSSSISSSFLAFSIVLCTRWSRSTFVNVPSFSSSSIFTPTKRRRTRARKVAKRLIGQRIIKKIYAKGAKNVSSRFGLLLNKVFGKNSPVKRMTSVDNNVSNTTRVAESNEANSVVSKICAKKIP